MRSLKFLVLRFGRRVLWPRPVLYCPLGVFRRRGNVLRSDQDVYICGFPRSGNTFATKAFLLANPNTRVRSINHIPTFAIQSVKLGHPGMIVIRAPLDAAVSWSIFHNSRLEDSLAYYIDFYRVLQPFQDLLFFARFEDIISDFGEVIRAFNSRWGTNFIPFEHNRDNAAACMKQIEDEYRDSNGEVIESKVPRPSVFRRPSKERMLKQISSATALQNDLREADRIFRALIPAFSVRKDSSPHFGHTSRRIQLRPL